MLRVHKIRGRLKKAVEYVLPVLKNLNITPANTTQVFSHDDSDGYDIVTVNAVTSDVDTNIKAENIKENVDILGVKGTYIGAKYKPRYVTFRNCQLEELQNEVDNLDLSLMINTANMFSNTMLKSLDLSNVTFGALEDMNYMFANSYYVETITFGDIDTSNVNNMSQMFRGCLALKTLDLSSFTSEKVYSTVDMFIDCQQLARLDMRNFDFTKLGDYRRMFTNVPSSCEIIVKDNTQKTWLNNYCPECGNVKTVAELG